MSLSKWIYRFPFTGFEIKYIWLNSPSIYANINSDLIKFSSLKGENEVFFEVGERMQKCLHLKKESSSRS